MEAINKDVIPVAEIMTAHPHTLDVNDTLEHAKKKFEKLKLRHLPVVDGEKLVGILSLTDILRLSFGDKFGANQYEADEAIFEMLSIDQVMNHNPRTISSNNSLREVGEVLSKEEFHALPVVDNDRLVGIVTTTDVIRYLLEH